MGANAVGPYFLALSLADLPRLLIISCGCILPFFLAGLNTIPNAATYFGQFFLLYLLTTIGAASVSYFGSACSGIGVVGFIISAYV